MWAYILYAAAAVVFVAGWYGTSYLLARYTKFGEGEVFCPACWTWSGHGLPLGFTAFLWPITLPLYVAFKGFFGLNKGATVCIEAGARGRTVVLDRERERTQRAMQRKEDLRQLMAADEAEREGFIVEARKDIEVFLDYGRK